MIFASDNWSGASDRIAAALAEASRLPGPAYGTDALTRLVGEAFARVFEREVAVFFVATGSAANALGLSAFARPGGVVFCHRDAHVLVDECGAAEFLAGMRTAGLDGPAGRIAPETLRAALDGFPRGVHHGQPAALSLSQLTEAGTVYRPQEIAALAGVAAGAGMAVHMDGARFANAVAHLGVAPADLTWRAGVDVLSFGGTKNGCWAAEAVVFFDPMKAEQFGFIRKRAGHLFSKSRFVAAQFAAYLADDHWLELAGRANQLAARLAEGIRGSAGGRLLVEPEGNEVFAVLSRDTASRLKAAHAVFHEWPAASLGVGDLPSEDEVSVRLVTSFQTDQAAVDRFVSLLG